MWNSAYKRWQGLLPGAFFGEHLWLLLLPPLAEREMEARSMQPHLPATFIVGLAKACTR